MEREKEEKREKSSLYSDKGSKRSSKPRNPSTIVGMTSNPKNTESMKHNLKAKPSEKMTKSSRPTYNLVSPSRLKNFDFKSKHKSTMIKKEKIGSNSKHSSQSQHLQYKRDKSKNSTPIKSQLLSPNNLKKSGGKNEHFMSVNNPLKFQQYKKEKLSNLGYKGGSKKPQKIKKKITKDKSLTNNEKIYSKSNFLKNSKVHFGTKNHQNTYTQEQTKSIQLSSLKASENPEINKRNLKSRKSQISYTNIKKNYSYKGKDPRDSIYEKILHGDSGIENSEEGNKSRSVSQKEEKMSLRSYVKESLNIYKEKNGGSEQLSVLEHKSVDLVQGGSKVEFRTHGSHIMR